MKNTFKVIQPLQIREAVENAKIKFSASTKQLVKAFGYPVRIMASNLLASNGLDFDIWCIQLEINDEAENLHLAIVPTVLCSDIFITDKERDYAVVGLNDTEAYTEDIKSFITEQNFQLL